MKNLSGFSFSMDRKPALALSLGLLAATGIWLLEISTPFGLGLIDDAISYIAAARALLSGQGFTRIWLATSLEPITHWPPGYPATLAAISYVLKIDPYRSARLLNMLVFGGNAVLLGLLGYKMTRSYVAGLILSLLFLSNPALLTLHSQALSEPLYLFVSLLAFFAFYCYLSSENPSQRWIVVAGIFTALSYLTRYAALSLLATFIVAIFILRPTWHKRFVSLGYFLISALPPVLAWMLRNRLVAGTATNRSIDWHPVTLENAQRGLRSFFYFLIPSLREWGFEWFGHYSSLTAILGIIIFSLLIWLLWFGLRYFSKPQENTRPEIISFTSALYIFGYMGSLLISLSFFDAATPLNDRILSPVYVAALILLIYFLNKLFEQGKIESKGLAGVVLLFLLLIFLSSQINLIATLQDSPTGFASWRWRESIEMEAIRNLPEDTLVYSNQAPAVYFWTDRPAMLIWNVEDTRKAVLSEDAVLAFFYPPDDESPEYRAYFAALTEGFTLIEKSGLGMVFSK